MLKHSLPIALLILLAACNSQPNSVVELVGTSFDEEVPLQGNLTFSFDQPLIADTFLNQWDSTAYLTFNPPIPGHFSWQSPSDLVFAPFQPLAPSTTYQATLSEQLLKHKGALKLTGDQIISFYTPSLKLDQSHAYWAEGDAGKERYFLHLELTFNYAVSPATLKEQLQIEIDGKSQKFKLLSAENNAAQRLYLTEFPMSETGTDIEVTINEAMLPVGGTNALSKAIETDLQVASPFLLTINEVTAQHDGAEGELIVTTSQEIKAKDVKRFISVEPSVDFEVKISAQSFRIVSKAFDASQQYELKIAENLRGVLGGKLKSSYNEQVSFGKLRPTIRFRDNQSVYLTTAGSQQIEAEIVNIPKLQAKIYKIYENNLLHFADQNYYYNDYYDEYEGYYYNEPSYSYYNLNSLGDVVWEKEIETTTLALNGNQRILKLDFEDKLGKYPGLYVLQLRANSPYYQTANTVFCRSDVGLIAKASDKSVMVFANSIKTAEALPGVEVSLIGRNNQVLATLNTDESGVIKYDFSADLAAGFDIKLVTAKYQDEFTYLPFSNTRVGTSRYQVEGKRENAAGLDLYLFAERDIYRPGETMHLAGIVREKDWSTPDDIPVKIKVRSPGGGNFTTIRKNLNKQGAFSVDIDIPVAARTGNYAAMIYTTNDVLLASRRILVEEFVPDRIKVSLNLDADEYRLADEIKMDLLASNFFGPPAADRNYEVNMSLRREGFYSKQHNQYSFYIPNLANSYTGASRNGQTNAEGVVEERFQIDQAYANSGILRATFLATVFDETGRPVSRRASAKIYTQDVFYGTRQTSYYNSTGNEVEIPIIAVNKKGESLTGVKAQVRLIKHEYKTVLAKSGSYFRYQSQPEEKILVDKEITLNGTDYVFKYTPELSGRYELRVSKPGVNRYVRSGFYAYGYGRTNYQSFQVNREGRIDIQLDKEQYKSGEKAKVLLSAPFDGKVLVTVESDRVLEHFYLQTDKRAASFELNLNAEHVPNVYVSATLFRPHEVSDLPITVAHGYAPVMVEKAEFKLPLSIEAVDLSRSRSKQTIKVKSTPNTAVTIAAVDEGILSLTSFQSPNPYEHFYSKRALEVTSYDVYPYLYPEIRMAGSRPGGDGGLEKRINPLVNNRVKLASFWSGILTTDSRGEASFEIDIPQFSGSLRVMATAFSGRAFAATQQNMQVADPVVISMGIPRFLSPGDTVNIPVTMANTTDNNAEVTGRLVVSGPLKVVGQTKQSTSIASKRESRLQYQVVAEPAIGQGKISFTAEAMGESFLNEIDITIRPASPLQKRSGAGKLTGGKTVNVQPDIEGFIPSSIATKLVISRSPLVEFNDDLEKLLVSRYSSLNHTVSRAYPQMYYKELVKVFLKKNDQNPNPNYHVQEAIKRLMLMQLRNGGMTNYPQRGRENWWGSAYALQFLFEAKREGYSVPAEVIIGLQEYLINKLKDVKLEPYYYNVDKRREVYPSAVGYTHFVLALTGKPQRSSMNYFKSKKAQLNLGSKYTLAGAYALSGDQKKYKEILPDAFEGEVAVTSFGDGYSSHLRDEALALYVMLEVDPDNPQIGTMAKHVSQSLRDRRYLNTLERAYSYLALGKLARKAAASTATAIVSFDGKEVGTMNGAAPLVLTTDQPAQGSYKIEVKGEGEVYYFWDTEGISADGSYIEEDSYLQVRKYVYDRSGTETNFLNLKQNDLVVVRLTLSGTTNTYVDNIVVTDLLPAGLEIENPRISQVAGMDWIRNRGRYDYMDVRDDRIMFFTSISGTNTQNFYYLARAVSPGTYQMGPVAADALYNGEYHSYHGAGMLRITK